MFCFCMLIGEWIPQKLVEKAAVHMSELSVFLCFADCIQCGALYEAAETLRLRHAPAPWVWDKTNKQASFKQVWCYPGATCVLLS